MFYKAEIMQVDLEIPDEYDFDVYRYYGFGRIVNLSKTGRVYIYDIFSNGTVKFRYCSDGDRFICYNASEDIWGHGTPSWNVNYRSVISYDEETNIEAREFFKKKSGSAVYILEDFAWRINRDKREHSEKAALSKMERNIAMFPEELSEDVKRWANEKVFNNYIFIGKKDKGKRYGTCEACGKKFKVDGKHKGKGVCPKCGRQSVFWLARYKDCIAEKKRINVFYRTRDYSLYRWTDVTKTFEGGKKYNYDDYWYSGECHENSRCNFAYGQHHNYGYMVKKDWLTPTSLADSYVYTPGMDESVGYEYSKYIKDGYKYNMLILARNLIKYPQTEYLLKQGLVNLAHEIRYYPACGDSRSLKELFGIEKKYIPLLVKYNATMDDLHLIMSISKTEHTSEELFLMCKQKRITSCMIEAMKRTFPQNASVGKILRYISKQKGSAENVVRTYQDYINMAHELKIELTKKYDIWPKNLQCEHDRLSEKITAIKNKKKNAAFKRGTKKIYKTVPEKFTDNEFCMVLPESTEDFSREGQNLKICVGSAYYAEKHKNGTSFICFIRKADEPEKSYVCCELDLKNYKIIQIHGYKNDVGKKLPSGTRAFAEKYLKAVQKFRKELKGA